MTLETLRSFLAWCTVVNGAVLLLWWLGFVLARDWILRLHGKWFRLSAEGFDDAHYRAMAHFKLAIIFGNLTPYLVLRLLV